MTWMTWIDKPRGMLLVEEDIPHRGGGGLLDTIKSMAACGSSTGEGELVESSQSADDRQMEANEEVDEKKHTGEEGEALPQHC